VTYVQPIVTLTTGTVTGYEALARFPGSVMPVINTFEKAWAEGQGPQLEAQALRSALSLTGRPPTAYLALNVSPRALATPGVIEALDVDLTGIVVELTEAHYVPTNDLKRTAEWLRERGAKLAIDDVGTGYAGLERIINLSPDLIKLDRSLVSQLPQDRVYRAMVESLVRFAAHCGASVCAEGIETQEELQVAAELDITVGQGFLFGHAKPAWSWPANQVVDIAMDVHRQALNATPKQALFLDEYVLLERLADRFSEAEELEDVHYAVSSLCNLVAAEHVAVSLVNEPEDQMMTINHETWAVNEKSYPLSEHPATRWVLDSRRAAQVLITDPKADPNKVTSMTEAGFNSLLMVPVTTNGRTVGLLEFYRRPTMPWSLTHIRLARIGASQLAATLDRLLLRGGELSLS
jgi:EAL domain-containing protein (putative c-di-GMP-specific phosphodiesterase class I)